MHLRYVNRKKCLQFSDNSRPPVSRTIVQKVRIVQYETLPPPPMSSDLSRTHNYFFKHLDHFVTRTRFTNETAAKNAFEEFLQSRTTNFYVYGINALVSRWETYIASNACLINNYPFPNIHVIYDEGHTVN
ncbi:Histone-lysine N-methyltransferase SETMAR [Araneus ventricosus]|uniref:Histone-lysine N-methyltransferase SETMAR n=1 Tax=Araneus ventricosus TaxID=182803 RepID=A0A4Y2AHV8_ARAVE|nr:Histone-lysine N-methyltransferase SETMAR [Araneus ventricosus]